MRETKLLTKAGCNHDTAFEMIFEIIFIIQGDPLSYRAIKSGVNRLNSVQRAMKMNKCTVTVKTATKK